MKKLDSLSSEEIIDRFTERLMFFLYHSKSPWPLELRLSLHGQAREMIRVGSPIMIDNTKENRSWTGASFHFHKNGENFIRLPLALSLAFLSQVEGSDRTMARLILHETNHFTRHLRMVETWPVGLVSGHQALDSLSPAGESSLIAYLEQKAAERERHSNLQSRELRAQLYESFYPLLRWSIAQPRTPANETHRRQRIEDAAERLLQILESETYPFDPQVRMALTAYRKASKEKYGLRLARFLATLVPPSSIEYKTYDILALNPILRREAAEEVLEWVSDELLKSKAYRLYRAIDRLNELEKAEEIALVEDDET